MPVNPSKLCREIIVAIRKSSNILEYDDCYSVARKILPFIQKEIALQERKHIKEKKDVVT